MGTKRKTSKPVRVNKFKDVTRWTIRRVCPKCTNKQMWLYPELVKLRCKECETVYNLVVEGRG